MRTARLDTRGFSVHAVACLVEAGGAATLTLEQVDGLWGRVKQRVKMEGRSKAFAMLLDTNPYEVRGNTVPRRSTRRMHWRFPTSISAERAP